MSTHVFGPETYVMYDLFLHRNLENLYSQPPKQTCSFSQIFFQKIESESSIGTFDGSRVTRAHTAVHFGWNPWKEATEERRSGERPRRNRRKMSVTAVSEEGRGGSLRPRSVTHRGTGLAFGSARSTLPRKLLGLMIEPRSTWEGIWLFWTSPASTSPMSWALLLALPGLLLPPRDHLLLWLLEVVLLRAAAVHRPRAALGRGRWSSSSAWMISSWRSFWNHQRSRRGDEGSWYIYWGFGWQHYVSSFLEIICHAFSSVSPYFAVPISYMN